MTKGQQQQHQPTRQQSQHASSKPVEKPNPTPSAGADNKDLNLCPQAKQDDTSPARLTQESKQKRSVLDAWLLKVTTEKAGPSTSTSRKIEHWHRCSSGIVTSQQELSCSSADGHLFLCQLRFRSFAIVCTRSQSPLNAEPKDEPALQVKGKPGPQGAAVQVKEEPGVQEAASEEKQEGSAQGKEASAQQPATEMKVEAKELVNAESVMQLKEEGGVQQQQKKRRLD
ncbi:hypothetical protein HPB51_008656 [Rhipicephalus microplus]|uniref:Uncharacterized protein n=1 Tax=Rhipicephalus microplus TaxID=6941 RepID=A0A9J6EFQ5_RHIMP|nr:hypothetical protein HPB51_008656 [Rhipicephalus microplus]